MPKAEELCEKLLGITFKKELFELGDDLKNAYPRKGYTLIKIDNMDAFCRKYAQSLQKSADKFQIDPVELHKKIIQIVKSNDINIKITNFVESREWEAYMDKTNNKQNNTKIG
jgi:hypothetical protein